MKFTNGNLKALKVRDSGILIDDFVFNFVAAKTRKKYIFARRKLNWISEEKRLLSINIVCNKLENVITNFLYIHFC